LFPMKRLASKRVLILSIGLAAGLLIVEAGLRVGLGLGHPPLSYADPDYGYAFRANQDLRRFRHRVLYNEQGLRSEPLPASKPQSELRVLCVGDSVTNGGVLTDQRLTYPSLLEGELKASGLQARVLNASAGSWGVENEEAFLRKRGLFDSDIVVLQVGTHDLWQKKSCGDKVGLDPSFPERDPPSAIYELVVRYGWPRARRLFFGGHAPRAPPGERDRQRCLAAINCIAQMVRGRGATLIILLTPNREELLEPDKYREWREPLFRLARQDAVPCVDALTIFRQAAAQGVHMFRDAVHPNPKGNRLIAEALCEEILKHVANIRVSAAAAGAR